MESFGPLIRSTRKGKSFTILFVYQQTGIDKAILSKIENGERIATKKQLETLITLFNLEEELAYTYWLKDKIIAQIKGEKYCLEAIKHVEKHILKNTTL